ncbi:SET domain-containing protein [Canariomyces notabilis]|uniref:SET domain-containing protein n=1 Tax=Canariomyces notabilis TaxID=2074819 RepID=A0AAN6TDK9_9PEZI|nr:SET domain-containing protein [Canariomyces arenarius]
MGFGVFIRPGCVLKKGEWIGEYLGELLPPTYPGADDSNYAFELPGFPAEGISGVVINAQRHGNWTRFVNSHCSPNVVAYPEQVGKVRIVAFRTVKRIVAGQQLFIAYGRQYFSGRGMLCSCNAQAQPHLPPEESD